MTPRALPLLLALSALATGGCKENPAPAPAPAPSSSGQRALGVDRAYARGKVKGVVVEMETRLEVPGLALTGKEPEVVRRAREASAVRQRFTITAHRGCLTFLNKDLHVPRGTELRLNPGLGGYLLADPVKKVYWVLGGAELGNLLEGGPAVTRTGFSIKITDSKGEQEPVAGYEVKRTDAVITFRGALPLGGGERREAEMTAHLAIWHTGHKGLDPAWGAMMMDFLTFPFQGKEGRDAVDRLKKRIRFPVKWEMALVERSARARARGKPARLVSRARSVTVTEVDRAALAVPPAGYAPASGPYTFGEGGQTVSPEVLSKIPALQGPGPGGKSEKSP